MVLRASLKEIELDIKNIDEVEKKLLIRYFNSFKSIFCSNTKIEIKYEEFQEHIEELKSKYLNNNFDYIYSKNSYFNILKKIVIIIEKKTSSCNTFSKLVSEAHESIKLSSKIESLNESDYFKLNQYLKSYPVPIFTYNKSLKGNIKEKQLKKDFIVVRNLLLLKLSFFAGLSSEELSNVDIFEIKELKVTYMILIKKRRLTRQIKVLKEIIDREIVFLKQFYFLKKGYLSDNKFKLLSSSNNINNTLYNSDKKKIILKGLKDAGIDTGSYSEINFNVLRNSFVLNYINKYSDNNDLVSKKLFLNDSQNQKFRYWNTKERKCVAQYYGLDQFKGEKMCFCMVSKEKIKLKNNLWDKIKERR